MKQNNSESENYLGNIADELGTISGTCTEIKEAQLNSATVEDVERVGHEVMTATAATVKALENSMTEPWDIMYRMSNQLAENTQSNRETIEDAEAHLSEKLDCIDTKITNKFDAFSAKPPVREVVHRIAKETWQWYLTIGSTVASAILFATLLFWQEGRIEQCRTSDIKYHFILMHNGVTSEGLDKIEEWFQDPEMVKQIENEVRDYQTRVQETARTLQQKHRLEEKLNELNSESTQ